MGVSPIEALKVAALTGPHACHEKRHVGGLRQGCEFAQRQKKTCGQRHTQSKSLHCGVLLTFASQRGLRCVLHSHAPISGVQDPTHGSPCPVCAVRPASFENCNQRLRFQTSVKAGFPLSTTKL